MFDSIFGHFNMEARIFDSSAHKTFSILQWTNFDDDMPIAIFFSSLAAVKSIFLLSWIDNQT